jgi:hypothetical protein
LDLKKEGYIMKQIYILLILIATVVVMSGCIEHPNIRQLKNSSIEVTGTDLYNSTDLINKSVKFEGKIIQEYNQTLVVVTPDKYLVLVIRAEGLITETSKGDNVIVYGVYKGMKRTAIIQNAIIE